MFRLRQAEADGRVTAGPNGLEERRGRFRAAPALVRAVAAVMVPVVLDEARIALLGGRVPACRSTIAPAGAAAEGASRPDGGQSQQAGDEHDYGSQLELARCRHGPPFRACW